MVENVACPRGMGLLDMHSDCFGYISVPTRILYQPTELAFSGNYLK